MIRSLERHAAGGFKIFVLAMDDVSAAILTDLAIPCITVVKLTDFENQDLIRVKPGRSLGEYCWTCTPAIIKFCLEKYHLPECTYLDADLYFFNDPVILFAELKENLKEVLITPHNYTSHFDQSKTSGIYCVQFMYFQNSAAALVVLNDWYEKCINWCFARVENGKFGDQKYLDVWPTQFKETVHSLKHLGAGAPWNIQRYKMKRRGTECLLKADGSWEPLVFYHFHSLTLVENCGLFRSVYPISRSVEKLVYEPYVQELRHCDDELMKNYSMANLLQIRSSLRKKDYYTTKYRLKMLFWKIFYFWFRF